MPLVSSLIRISSAARRSGVAKVPPSISRDQITSASPRAAEITSSIAPRPPERARSSGSCPSGSSANRRLLPGNRCGSARSAARPAAFCPAQGGTADIPSPRPRGPAFVGGKPRRRQIVEVVALVKQRRLRRIQVFGRHILFQRTAAERDHTSAHIHDRKHHPVTKPVPRHWDIVARDQEPGFHHVLD